MEQAQLTAQFYTNFRRCYEAMQRCEMQESGTQRTRLEEALLCAKRWDTGRVTGNFIVLLVRQDGTILITEDLSRVYLVLGITQSIGALLNRQFQLPVVVKAPRRTGFVIVVCIDRCIV